MTTAVPEKPPVQAPLLFVAGAIGVALLFAIQESSTLRAWLFVVGLGLGFSLYHASFGFTAAYRNAMVGKDLSGVAAQAVMLVLAMSLFAPFLSVGEIAGHRASPTIAPISVAMLSGAFIFGIGMQIGNGCASGTLFTTGGGSTRMVITLIFFCIGSWWGTLDIYGWRALPNFGAYSLGKMYGYGPAVAIQTVFLGVVIYGLYRWGARLQKPLWWNGGFSWQKVMLGPWPLLLGGISLALLNFAHLAVTGRAWGVTFGFTIWGAKGMEALGWDPDTSKFWSQKWAASALNNPILESGVSVSNIGIVVGAAVAATLASKFRPTLKIGWGPLLAAIIGGLAMGYGARLAYGCNIGAFFAGVVSTSLHGWAWLGMALLGSVIGIRLRPIFGLGK